MPVHEIASNVTVEVYRGGADVVDKMAPVWRSLCPRSAADEPFCRPEWIAAWHRAFAPGQQVIVLAAYSDGEIAAVLPLLQSHSFFCGIPVRKLYAPANVFSTRFDIIRAAGPRGETAVRAIWESIREFDGWDVIEFPEVPQNGSMDLLLKAAEHDGFATGAWPGVKSPYVPLAGYSDAGLIPADSHFRQNLRRRLRKANAKFSVSLSRFDRADPIALEAFYRLESSGWKGKNRTSIISKPETRIFHDELARAAAEFGYFSLYLLKFDDIVVAGHYGLTYAGRYYIPKVAYDERYASYGPGHLIIHAVLDDCLARGVREFDFLGPWMDWKAEWARDARQHSCCYVFRPNIFGRTLRLAKFRVMGGLRSVAKGLMSLGSADYAGWF